MIKKSCYLLFDLAVELQQLYEMYCVNEIVRGNEKMKHFLQENFMLHASMLNSCGNPIVVHAHEVNLVYYAHRINHWGYFRVSNRRGAWNKRVGWTISAKIINGEGAINRDFGTNL